MARRSELAILLGGVWTSKNWRQDSGGNTGKNEDKRWLGTINETDWRLFPLFACCWYFHGSLPPSTPPWNFNLSELRRLFLPPWLCGPSVPLMRAETRVGCAVCMPSRVGPQSQGKAARPSMRTFVLGFPLRAFRRERGWLAAAAGPMGAGQWPGAPESRASFPLPPSPPVPLVIVPWLLVLLFKIRRNPPLPSGLS